MIAGVVIRYSYGFHPDRARSPPETEHPSGIDAAAVSHAVLAVAGEDEVVGVECAGRADLRRLLSEQRSPQPELALPLQRGGLGVDAPDDHEIAIDLLHRSRVDVRDQR